jgi:hypothetical protein
MQGWLNPGTQTSSVDTIAKIAALRKAVADTLVGWKNTRNMLAGSILQEFGSDNSPSLSRLDALTAPLEVPNDGTASTRTGSPFPSTGEETPSSSPDVPPGADTRFPSHTDPPTLLPTPPRVEPDVAQPTVPLVDAAPRTALENLLGEYVSSAEDFEEILPAVAGPLHRTLPPHPDRSEDPSRPARPPRRYPRPKSLPATAASNCKRRPRPHTCNHGRRQPLGTYRSC